MKTILFYGRDGAKAKERAKVLRKEKGRVVIYDVTVWEGGKDGADHAEIMDCVSYFDRQRIEHVFGVSDDTGIDPVEIAKIRARADEAMAGKEFISIEKIEDVIKPVPKKRGRKPKAVEAD